LLLDARDRVAGGSAKAFRRPVTRRQRQRQRRRLRAPPTHFPGLTPGQALGLDQRSVLDGGFQATELDPALGAVIIQPVLVP
jgi:hypothetical protein